jgi:hypothetical protein
MSAQAMLRENLTASGLHAAGRIAGAGFELSFESGVSQSRAGGVFPAVRGAADLTETHRGVDVGFVASSSNSFAACDVSSRRGVPGYLQPGLPQIHFF